MIVGNSFLLEQLERVKRMTERVAQAHRVAETSEFASREQETDRGSLEDVRDCRTHQSPDYGNKAPDRSSRSSRRKRR